MHLGNTRVGLDAPHQHVNRRTEQEISSVRAQAVQLLCSTMTKTKCVFQVWPLLLRLVLLLVA